MAWNVWSEVDDQLGLFCLANNGGLSQVPTISPVGTLSQTVRSLYILTSMNFIAEYSLEYNEASDRIHAVLGGGQAGASGISRRLCSNNKDNG